MNGDQLINAVVTQIVEDLESGDTSALAELLRMVPVAFLEDYIAEGMER